MEIQFQTPPKPVYRFQREYEDAATPALTPESNFLKGVKWSPDGLCFLTASDDNWLRIYDVPPEALESCLAAAAPAAAGHAAATSGAAAAAAAAAAADDGDGGGGDGAAADSFAPAVRIHGGELVYDYAWYPRMAAADAASCCLATACRAHPVRLWDACTGELRCTYRAYDSVDEVAPAYSLAFSLDGGQLYAGVNRAIHVFDVTRPGRDHATITTYRKGREGQPGIISCLAPNPDGSGMLAAGSYFGAAALYDVRTSEALCVLEGHAGGITQVRFSPCGNYLYTGARKDPDIMCWDVRQGSGVLYTLRRDTAATNQRVAFDIEPCGRHLATGGERGRVQVFDLRGGEEVASFEAAQDTVNGLHFHPHLPLLATASGHRRYYLAPSDSDASGGEEDAGAGGRRLAQGENVLRVWRLAARWVSEEEAAQELERFMREAGGGGDAAAMAVEEQQEAPA